MDALKNLVGNVPDWLKRLDELNGQIEQRQVELAQLTESQSPATTKSVKNKGSTESLKPRDESPAFPRGTTPPLQTPQPLIDVTMGSTPSASAAADVPAPSSPANSNTPSALQRQTSQVKAAGQAKARATLRKRQRTDSVLSAEGAAPKYRTRSMIIVYYDSYVQSFFEELVKFVSASRNMMRKAKMAARVAHIRRMAELEMPDSDGEEVKADGEATAAGANLVPQTSTTAPLASPTLAPDTPLEADSASKDDEDGLPPLHYVSTRRMQPVKRSPHVMMTASGRPLYPRGARGSLRGLGGHGTEQEQPDVYDELDKCLEYVQSMCEHAAHQFLRDGDCGEEVSNIKRRLQDTKELSDKEMERVKKEDPEALNAPPENASKGRNYRPQTMRRDLAASYPKEAPSNDAGGIQQLEVDEGIHDMDEDEAIPKLVFKSTRMMR